MTVQNTLSEVTFTGDGIQTSFVFTFRVDDIAWLTLSYLVSFNMIILNGDQEADPGGSLEYFVAPPSLQQLTIQRDVPLTQLVDYTRHGPFDSESHEGALDKLTMAIQDRDQKTAQKSKSITIESPSGSESITTFFTPVGLTVSEIRAILRGVAPSVTWTLRFAPDRTDTGTEVIIGGTVTVNETTGDDITAMDNVVIPADSFVWLETTAIAGSVEMFHITIRYTEELP